MILGLSRPLSLGRISSWPRLEFEPLSKARRMVRDLTSTGQASTVDADTSQRSEQAKRWRYLGIANTIAAVIVSASAIRFLPWPWSLAILLVMIAAVVETWRLARKIRRA